MIEKCKQLVFVAKRQDGLGERLRAIINAFALAEVFDAKFYFHWDDSHVNDKFHVTNTVKDVFSEDFIQNYHIGLEEIPKDVLPVSSFFENGGGGWFFCDQSIADGWFFDDKDRLSRYKQKVQEAFWKLGYSELVSEAIQLALHANIGEKVFALHLRAGDIVYGPYRPSVGLAHKVISYPVASEAIQEMKSAGCESIVFGEDLQLIDHLKKKHSVSSSSEWIPESFRSFQAAFFDVVLMSRCDRICAGSSGFAFLAGAIGKARFTKVKDMFSDQEVVNIILRNLKNRPDVEGKISSEQISFSCKVALVYGHSYLDRSDVDFLVEVGSKMDPGNGLFEFVRGLRWLNEGFLDEGVKVIDQLLMSGDKYKHFYRYNFTTPYGKDSFKRSFDCGIVKDHATCFGSKNVYDLIAD